MKENGCDAFCSFRISDSLLTLVYSSFKAFSVFKSILGEKDARTVEASQWLNIYTKKAVFAEKQMMKHPMAFTTAAQRPEKAEEVLSSTVEGELGSTSVGKKKSKSSRRRRNNRKSKKKSSAAVQ